MNTSSLSRIAAFTGGLAVAFTAGIGLASADPAEPGQPGQPAEPGQPVQPGQPSKPGQWSSQNSAVNTTCSYAQVVAAMKAESPETAAQFDTTPMAQGFLQDFLAAPPLQREQMLQQAQASPEGAQFVNLVGPLAMTCDKY